MTLDFLPRNIVDQRQTIRGSHIGDLRVRHGRRARRVQRLEDLPVVVLEADVARRAVGVEDTLDRFRVRAVRGVREPEAVLGGGGAVLRVGVVRRVVGLIASVEPGDPYTRN
jgi:hypothetical protein